VDASRHGRQNSWAASALYSTHSEGAAMKERQILFSAPMVRAILDGSKTQTRRLAPVEDFNVRDIGKGMVAWRIGFTKPMGKDRVIASNSGGKFNREQATSIVASQFCRQGQRGDRLWVRETFYAFGRWETRFSAKKGRDEWHFVDLTLDSGKTYRYTNRPPQPQLMGVNRRSGGTTPAWWKRPAIHMPRAASRITLEVTGVRVERLQDISEADAIAEGIECLTYGGQTTYRNYSLDDELAEVSPMMESPVHSFRTLWESINGPDSWAANPWVWVVEFNRVQP
jgi:hypothetical protein